MTEVNLQHPRAKCPIEYSLRVAADYVFTYCYNECHLVEDHKILVLVCLRLHTRYTLVILSPCCPGRTMRMIGFNLLPVVLLAMKTGNFDNHVVFFNEQIRFLSTKIKLVTHCATCLF